MESSGEGSTPLDAWRDEKPINLMIMKENCRSSTDDLRSSRLITEDLLAPSTIILGLHSLDGSWKSDTAILQDALLESYDGTMDPLDHLASYKIHMMIQGASDALYYLAFSVTLGKVARIWYPGLKLGSIHSFS